MANVMSRYQKKPVIIDAEQFSYNSVPWPGGVVKYKYADLFVGDVLSICDQCDLPLNVHGAIRTLEAPHRVCPVDLSWRLDRHRSSGRAVCL